MSQNKQLGVLPFYDNRSKQNHLKWWNYDRVFALITELDTLPPFQIQKKKTGHAVSHFVLVNFNTNEEIDILASATTAGLNVAEFDNYDLIIYPSTVLLGVDDITPGHYYLRITSSGDTFYSEVFNMSDDVSGFIKLEYYHNDKFCIPEGHIEYTHPYKNRIYINADIAKPSYEYEEQVVKREGFNFPVQQVSFKLHRFVMLAPEYLTDVLRIIRMHDVCEISYAGYFYDVDELLMNNPKWLNNGDLAEVEVEFKTDTVVVSNSKGVAEFNYSAPEGSCLIVDHECVAMIVKDSTDYINFQYTPASGGTPVSLVEGDEVLINDIIAKRIEVFEYVTGPASYEQQPLLPDEIAFDANANKYFFAASDETDNVVEPFITSISNIGANGLCFGEAFSNTVVEVWVKYTDSNGIVKEEKRGQALSSKLTTSGVPFIYDPTIIQLRLKASSAICSLFSTGPWYTVQVIVASGIGLMGIEFDFIIG